MKKIKIVKLNNLLEFAIWILTLVFFIKGSKLVHINDKIENVIIGAASSILVLHIIIERYSIRQLLIYFVIISLALYTTIKTKQSLLLETVLVIMAIRNYDFNRIIEIMYDTSKKLLCIHMFVFFILVVIGKQQFFINYFGRMRAAFGFVHPNLFSIYLFNIILMWVWLNLDKLSYSNIFTIFCIITCSYICTNTRTAYYTELICLILMILYKNKIYPKKIFTSILFPSISMIMYWLIMLYSKGNSIAFKVNELLSGRIQLGVYAFKKYGMTLLGREINYKINWDEKWKLNSFTFDSLYTYLIFSVGIFWLVLISYCIYKASKKSKKNQMFLLIWILYSITEIHPLSCFYLFPILLFSEALKGERSSEKRKNISYNNYSSL